MVQVNQVNSFARRALGALLRKRAEETYWLSKKLGTERDKINDYNIHILHKESKCYIFNIKLL